MPNIKTWFSFFHSRGIRLFVTSNDLSTLKCTDEQALTPGDRSVLATSTEVLLRLLDRWEEKAAILEYIDGHPRAEAERLAWEALEIVAPGETEEAA